MYQVRAVHIYTHHFLDGWFSPIVPNSRRHRDAAEDLFQLAGFNAKARQVLARNPDLNGYSNWLSGFECSRIDDCSGYLLVKRRLQKG